MQQHCLLSVSDNLQRAQAIRGGGRLGIGTFPLPFLLIIGLNMQPGSPILIFPDAWKGTQSNCRSTRTSFGKAYSISPGPGRAGLSCHACSLHLHMRVHGHHACALFPTATSPSMACLVSTAAVLHAGACTVLCLMCHVCHMCMLDKVQRPYVRLPPPQRAHMCSH